MFNLEKISNNTIIIGGIILSLTLVALFLPLCQSYMSGQSNANHSKMVECCGAEKISNLTTAQHIDYLQTLLNISLSQSFYELLLSLFVVLFVFVSIVFVDKSFFATSYSSKIFSMFPDIILWKPLQFAYSHGIIQGKHLD